ncbi:hypothetical protein CHARACLAT_031621 [Characodon lateralis]|uniref:Uncharacterized protein n=1 Tax=Characodon lateralis TaxID=208331 RepID=A0ABU7D540_9TELE|nr:hypothetical protein [Characodon lateralis]
MQRRISLECKIITKIILEYNICDTNCKVSDGDTSNLMNHPVKHKTFLKSEPCTIFDNLRCTATTHAFSTVSMLASVSNSLSAASNKGEKIFETTEMLQYKQLDVECDIIQ